MSRRAHGWPLLFEQGAFGFRFNRSGQGDATVFGGDFQALDRFVFPVGFSSKLTWMLSNRFCGRLKALPAPESPMPCQRCSRFPFVEWSQDRQRLSELPRFASDLARARVDRDRRSPKGLCRHGPAKSFRPCRSELYPKLDLSEPPSATPSGRDYPSVDLDWADGDPPNAPIDPKVRSKRLSSRHGCGGAPATNKIPRDRPAICAFMGTSYSPGKVGRALETGK